MAEVKAKLVFGSFKFFLFCLDFFDGYIYDGVILLCLVALSFFFLSLFTLHWQAAVDLVVWGVLFVCVCVLYYLYRVYFINLLLNSLSCLENVLNKIFVHAKKKSETQKK